MSEVKGNVVEILQTQTGEGKNGTWNKRGFVIETEDKYPKKIAIDVWNDDLEMPKVTDNVTVSINIESREHNGRYFTNVQAWKIDGATESKDSGFPANEEPAPIGDEVDEMPF